MNLQRFFSISFFVELERIKFKKTFFTGEKFFHVDYKAIYSFAETSENYGKDFFEQKEDNKTPCILFPPKRP